MLPAQRRQILIQVGVVSRNLRNFRHPFKSPRRGARRERQTLCVEVSKCLCIKRQCPARRYLHSVCLGRIRPRLEAGSYWLILRSSCASIVRRLCNSTRSALAWRSCCVVFAISSGLASSVASSSSSVRSLTKVCLSCISCPQCAGFGIY